MASLSVLFERPPEAARIAEALFRAGFLDGGAGSPVEHALRLDVEGTPIEVKLVESAVAPALLAEAADGGGRSDRAPLSAHAAHASVQAISLLSTTVRGPHDRLREMAAATRVAGALLGLPGALALLDEEGRVLTDAAFVRLRLSRQLSTPPLDLWIGVRSFELADAQGWFFDTLGMSQLALPDLEAYSSDGAGAAEMASWLRMVCLHLAQAEAPLSAGDTLDGPDDAPWITVEDRATVEPERVVLRFAPVRRP